MVTHYIITKFTTFNEKFTDKNTESTYPGLWLKPKPLDELELLKWKLSFSESIRDGEFVSLLLDDELPMTGSSWGGSEIEEKFLRSHHVGYMSFLHKTNVVYPPKFIRIAIDLSDRRKELGKLNNKQSFDITVPRIKDYPIRTTFTYNEKRNTIDYDGTPVISDLTEVDGYRTAYQKAYVLSEEQDLKDGSEMTYTKNTNTGKNSYLSISGKSNYDYIKIKEAENRIEGIKKEIQSMDLSHVDEFIQDTVIPNIKVLKREIAKLQTLRDSGVSDQERKEMEDVKRKEKTDRTKEKRQEKQKLIEEERDMLIEEKNIPTTIDEFLSRGDTKKCTDAVTGDLILTKEGVFGGSFKNPTFLGHRRILGLIEKENYGDKRGQHTFTIYVLDSDGEEEYSKGDIVRRMGRTLYKDCLTILYADQSVRDEKHQRGLDAKESKYWGWISEAELEGKLFKVDKIPRSFLTANKKDIIDGYPTVSNHLNL